MGNFSKWQKDNSGSGGLRVVLLVERNKDNKHIDGFEERRRAYTTTKTNEELKDDFDEFRTIAKPGVVSRMYVSINRRDNAKTQKALQHFLLDMDIEVQTLPAKVAAIAAKQENKLSADNYRFFDLDTQDPVEVEQFVNDMNDAYRKTMAKNPKASYDEIELLDYKLHPTRSGYAVIVDKRFDTRELFEKHPDVALKVDDMLLIYWA